MTWHFMLFNQYEQARSSDDEEYDSAISIEMSNLGDENSSPFLSFDLQDRERDLKDDGIRRPCLLITIVLMGYFILGGTTFVVAARETDLLFMSWFIGIPVSCLSLTVLNVLANAGA